MKIITFESSFLISQPVLMGILSYYLNVNSTAIYSLFPSFLCCHVSSKFVQLGWKFTRVRPPHEVMGCVFTLILLIRKLAVSQWFCAKSLDSRRTVSKPVLWNVQASLTNFEGMAKAERSLHNTVGRSLFFKWVWLARHKWEIFCSQCSCKGDGDLWSESENGPTKKNSVLWILNFVSKFFPCVASFRAKSTARANKANSSISEF